MGDETKTSTTTLPEPTEADKQLHAQESAMIQAILDQAGYSMTTTPTTTYKNAEKVESLKSTVSSLTEQKTSIQKQIETIQNQPGYRPGAFGQYSNQISQLQQQLTNIDRQLVSANQTLSNEMSDVTTTYESTVEKKEDPRVTALREKGDDAGADALKAQLDDQANTDLTAREQLVRDFTAAAEKAVSGDFSISETQKAQIDAFASQYRDPIMKTIDSLKAEIGQTTSDTLAAIGGERAQILANQASMSEAFDKMVAQVKETGLSVEDALTEASVRATQNGVDMNAALDESIAASKALTAQGLFETTKSVRRANAQLAAALGRSTNDPALVAQLNEKLLDATKTADLNLSAMAATGKLQISQDVAKALQSISDYKIQLRESQGSKLEQISGLRAQSTQDTGNQLLGTQQEETSAINQGGLRLEDVAKLRTGVEQQTQQIAGGLRLQAANPLAALQPGGSAISTMTGLQQLPLSNLMSANAPIQQGISQENALRAAQPTTTTTTSGSIFGQLLAGLGVGASGAGSIMSGVGALR